jgi:hypothetical protein
MDSFLNGYNFNTYFRFEKGQHHSSNKIRVNIMVGSHNH